MSAGLSPEPYLNLAWDNEGIRPSYKLPYIGISLSRAPQVALPNRFALQADSGMTGCLVEGFD